MQKRAKEILLVIAAPVAVLLFFELGPLLLGLPPLAEGKVLFPGGPLHLVEAGSCNPDFRLAPGEKAALALGGSSTFGWPLGPEQAFPAKAGKILAGKVRFFNAAALGQDSSYMVSCAREFRGPLHYLVAYDGHNDFINFGTRAPERTQFLYEHRWLLTVLRLFLRHSQAPRWLNLLPPSGEPLPVTLAQLRRNHDLATSHFLKNMEALAEIAKTRQATVLLVTSVSNASEFPPMAVADGGPEQNAPRHFERGKELHRLGRYGDSLEEFRKARDLDAIAYRAPSSFNEALRSFAKNRPGVALLDLEKILEEKAPRAWIGCNYFGNDSYCDHLHPNERLHELFARELSKRIAEISAP